ncbi:hypothetical protein BZA70DRAFT_272171 [Myxozyma melibiosi]|uniref:ADF-H domain-containing protein n=1 Tax=Myxozyma melibiosi TaxID=54550 RepID=A0ABR1FD48_9ASCO
MSNQSGIKSSPELLQTFKQFSSDGSLRTLLISIENESLEPGSQFPVKSNYFDDMAQLSSVVKPNAPLYILHRKDEGNEFTLISYIPDAAPVRHKMLYASTRNTLMRELGSDKIASSFFTTEQDELSAEGLRKFVAHEQLSNPLSEEERALKSVMEIEAKEGLAGTTTRKSHVSSGLSFPVSDSVRDALSELEGGRENVAVLELDVSKESVELATRTTVEDPSQLSEVISTDAPRYTFFLFEHGEGAGKEKALVFIYTCPSSAKIKERMLYASCRAAVIAEAEGVSGMKVARKIEASDGSEITRASLEADLRPAPVAAKQAFARPKAPGRRR